ncbi:MAG TPA: tetratricopeptide repeat protein [Magnetovibrio sp.]
MNISEQLTRGFQFHQQGQLAQAKAIYDEVLKIEPNNANALYLIGTLALQTGNVQPGTQYLIHAFNNGCTEEGLFINLSKTLRSQNNATDALHVLLKGGQAHPNSASIYVLLGIAYRELSQPHESINALTHAIEINGNISDAHIEIALTYKSMGKADKAEEHFKQAIALTANVTTHGFYASFLSDIGRDAEAIEEFRKAVAFDPRSELALNQLGFHLYSSGHIDESIDAFERCLEINPGNAETHGLYAFPLLLKGDYAKGWKEYEWRFKTPSFPALPVKLASPMWQNEPIEGKTLLLLGEQGFGDTFQFVRYAEQLASMGASVVIAAPSPAVELLKSAPGVSDVVPLTSDKIPAHDYHIYMMSLPERLNSTLATIPNTVPYLFPYPALTATWKDYFSEHDKFKVGIVWAGNPNQRNNPKRSCPLAALSPLFGLEDVQVFSLAKDRDEAEGPLPAEMIDLGSRINNFSDTAAILANLDLVISVCTSTAHLAGAMGRPVWVLLAASADWRWLTERSDSPWYPTARLLRQDTLHNWDQLLTKVAEDLSPQRRQKLLS